MDLRACRQHRKRFSMSLTFANQLTAIAAAWSPAGRADTRHPVSPVHDQLWLTGIWFLAMPPRINCPRAIAQEQLPGSNFLVAIVWQQLPRSNCRVGVDILPEQSNNPINTAETPETWPLPGVVQPGFRYGFAVIRRGKGNDAGAARYILACAGSGAGPR
jgi:hypothetical protein